MVALKVLGTLALVAGVTIELAGWLPEAAGLAGNTGAVIAVALWALAAFSTQKDEERKGR